MKIYIVAATAIYVVLALNHYDGLQHATTCMETRLYAPRSLTKVDEATEQS